MTGVSIFINARPHGSLKNSSDNVEGITLYRLILRAGMFVILWSKRDLTDVRD